MRTQRSVVDYALARRATLADLWHGRVAVMDVCDAHPYLLRAARYHGEPTEVDCPVCKRERLLHVTYVYGDELKDSGGQVRTTEELHRIEMRFAELTVYVVEVCRTCGWNHLTTRYQLGTKGLPRRRAPRQAQSQQSAKQ